MATVAITENRDGDNYNIIVEKKMIVIVIMMKVMITIMIMI